MSSASGTPRLTATVLGADPHYFAPAKEVQCKSIIMIIKKRPNETILAGIHIDIGPVREAQGSQPDTEV